VNLPVLDGWTHRHNIVYPQTCLEDCILTVCCYVWSGGELPQRGPGTRRSDRRSLQHAHHTAPGRRGGRRDKVRTKRHRITLSALTPCTPLHAVSSVMPD